MDLQDTSFAVAAQLLPLDQYRAQRETIFPSLGSFQWWMRSNRGRAIQAGALLMVRGRWHVVPAKMDACIEQVGTEAARRQLVPA